MKPKHHKPFNPFSFILKISLVFLLFSIGLFGQKPEKDRFGGFTLLKQEATGHFRVENVNGRWMFITPEGHPYVALGVNHVGKFLTNKEQSHALLRRFDGDMAAAEEFIFQSMKNMSLNASEAYVPLLPSLTKRMPYVAHIDFPNGEKFRFDVFDPKFQSDLEKQIQTHCESIENDPFVLGIAFADLPVWNTRRMEYFRKLPSSSPGKQRYIAYLRNIYKDIASLNKAYHTNFQSFNSIDSLNPENENVIKDDDVFLAIIADTLYFQLQKYLRSYAPNKLFFGERFVLRMVSPLVLEKVGKYVDVFCTQALILSPQRPPEWQVFQKEGYDKDHLLSGSKPMLIIDWAAPFSLDSTYPTERGVIKNELTASIEAAQWLESVFTLPYVVGVFKCQMIGSHGNDRWFPEGRMKRTYLRDDGLAFPHRTEITKASHEKVLSSVYKSLKN